MPERIECQVFTDQLNNKYCGKDIAAINLVGGRFLNKNNTDLHKAKFPLLDVKFNCKGKQIYWTFKGNISLLVNLGMTGSFGNQNKYSAVEFDFGEEKLYFNDMRRFGSIKFLDSFQELKDKLNSLGWDPFVEQQMPQTVIKSLRKKNKKTIAEALLDQKIFAGVGNYIKSEILYRGKVLPSRLVSSIDDQKLYELGSHIVDIMNEAYQHGGATLANYKDMNGIEGTFYQKFQVYSKKTDPLGNIVLRERAPDGRTSHFVLGVQT